MPAGAQPLPTDTDLTGRVALISAASRGIGLAIAAELLARGANVTITARRADQLTAAADRLAGAGVDRDRVLTVTGNSGDPTVHADAVSRTVERFGRLDILVNNTGINPVYGPLMEADLAAVSKIFEVNVVAALGFTQQAYRAWMAGHGGVVINMASVTGLRSSGVIGAYGASKAALIRLTEELAWQLGPSIRVNAIAPGVVKTRFAAALYEGRQDEAGGYPAGRLGAPEDVAKLVGFLASDAAPWITGETIRVDGGLLATGPMMGGG